MKISALRIPAALAACFAVVLAGAPGASAAPPSPAPGVATAPAATAPSATDPVATDGTAAAAATAAPLDPVDDAVATAGPGRTAAVDVLANDGLQDSAQVRLLLVDPSAPRDADELRTAAGLLRVITPGTAPAELPEGWLPPEHPVLALTPAEDAPAGAVEVGYAVRDATGAEARAVLTVTPEAPGDPSGEPETATVPTAEPATSPTAEPSAVPTADPGAEASAGSRAAAADPGADAAVPAEVRQALEAAAAREAARTGEPSAAMRPVAGGWEWPHANGVVLWSEGHGAHYVHVRAPLGQKWVAGGEVAGLGYPVNDEVCGMVGGGCRQTYSKGRSIYWSPATGAKLVHLKGAIGQKWGRYSWERGILGYPVGDQICGMAGGGCRQAFSNGRSIYWSPATGAKLVHLTGAIGQKWGRYSWERGALGYPAGDQICGMAGGGCRQTFSNGRSIYWSPATGARIVRLQSDVGRKWGWHGWERGALGYPTGDYVPQGRTAAYQKFRHGIVTWNASSGTRVHMFRGECQNLNNGRSVQPTRNAGRVSLTIAEGYGRSEATFVNCVRIGGSYVEEWRTSAYVGASGFKRPGVPSGHTQYLYSPQGSYSVTESFGVYNPGTALPYRPLNPNSRWGGRLGTLYNKYFESTGYTWPDENMWYFAQSGDYRLGVVINYNRPPDSPIVQGNGFAIFLHANKKPTAGCIALHEHEVARYMRTARPGDRIIMGVRADLFR
ncbi:L,D-transpeptidase family protein [Kocuria oceani]|uniref:L,D-transpeptidase family protein n=1 Tax=Kocuria oceani TaxID=988827 RepID=A0ABV9TGA2_9MICC|nr:L,D-transpeptidase family protein [Kocuria oceani]